MMVVQMPEDLQHIPVMPDEVIEYLNLQPKDTVLDCTLGLAGHASRMAACIGSEGHLIGIDQDDQALAQAKENLSAVSCKQNIVKSNFRKFDEVLENLGVKQVDGILVDLGVSSLQLDEAQRGFSFNQDGPLDMRMDQEGYVTAFELINSLTEDELARILKEYGEERFAYRIARGIVYHREQATINTTQKLSEIITKSVPGRFRHGRLHPATRSFQAIRIAVNRELEVLEEFLEKALDYLSVRGRLAIIAFHSLEDRIVKNVFRQWKWDHKVDLLTKKPLRPTDEECEFNKRARSARLRVIEKL